MMRPLRVEPSALVGDLACPGDLGTFVVALFAERRQQDDAVVFGESVGDASCGRAERVPSLEQPVAERSGERHACHRSEIGEPVDDDHGSVPFGCVEAGHPLDDLVVQLDPSHPAIIAETRSSHNSDDQNPSRPLSAMLQSNCQSTTG